MNKVITINLHGNACQLEEAGYEALRDYLDRAARQLVGNPDKDEIMADIEQAIADKCRAVLNAYRNVVSAQDIKTIIAEMGPVDDGSARPDEKTDAAGPSLRPGATDPAGGATGLPKRLYRVKEGAMLAGVCNGIAVYFDIDVTFVRLAVVALAFLTFGTVLLAYLIMMFVIPAADTAAAKAAAFGTPNTAQEFIRRARAGYYEGMKTFGDKQAHREWKRRFKQEMRGWKRNFHQQMGENARQWQQNWQNYWCRPPPHPGAGFGFVLFFTTLLRTLITLVWIFVLISFLCTGTIFGFVFFATLPWWLGLILLIVAYKLVTWPLRVIRYSYFYGVYGPRAHSVFFGLGDTLGWLVFLTLFIWLADRYIPEAHQALMHLPVILHHVADNITQWWSQK